MPHLSHSSMETWAQCPRRYYLQKIAHAPEAPSRARLFGSAVHAAVEEDGRRRMAGERLVDLPLMAALMRAFAAALRREQRAKDPDGLLDDELDDMRLQGLAVLRAYAEEVAPRFYPVAVEDEFTVAMPEVAPDAETGEGWRFTGRIDARTRPPDLPEGAAPIIVDFKTAGHRWAVGVEHTKGQADAYLWADACRARGVSTRPKPPVAERVTFVTLPVALDTDAGSYACHLDARPTTRSGVQLARFLERVQRTAGEITAARRAGERAFVARPTALCGWCPCVGSCGAGREWLKRRGRVPVMSVVSGRTATVAATGTRG